MTIRRFNGVKPVIGERVYVDPQASVIGDVDLGEDASIWPQAVLRGDVHSISIGRASNIQDGSVCHVTHRSSEKPNGHELIVGDEVTVGHSVTLHGCQIGNQCLIGIGCIVLDGAVLEPHVLLAAGSLVPPGAKLEGGYLWLGSPAVKKRKLTEAEMEYFAYSAKHYVTLKNQYLIE